jgi:hypothetical protein
MRRLAPLLAAFALIVLVVGAWRIRVGMTEGLPIWDPASPVGVMKSDPALLFWFSERIAEAGGALPDDLAACTSVQWPDAVDARVEFPQLQPWLAAASWRAFGGAMPLHAWCATFFSLLAALTLVGVHGLARELTSSRTLALSATALAFVLPANLRTATHLLLGEDVALPALAIHFWLLARAARTRTPLAFALAGAPLAIALAAWHATGFFVAIEAGAFLAWWLRRGENPLAVRHAWLVLAAPGIAGLAEPMLRGKLALLSLPLLLGYVLLLAAAVERRKSLGGAARIGFAAGALGVLVALSVAIGSAAGSGGGDYSHVFRLIAAKLRHFGQFPDDPAALPFEVRILWQGPFDTTSPGDLFRYLSLSLLGALMAMVLAWPAWRRRKAARTAADAESRALPFLAPALLVALVAAWLIHRTVVLAGVLFPVATVLAAQAIFARNPKGAAVRGDGGATADAAACAAAPSAPRFSLVAAAALLPLVAAAWFPTYVRRATRENLWHDPAQAVELRGAIAAIEKVVPKGEAILCDEVNGTAVLAHARRPILAQPKYEWTAARERLEEFRTVATHGSPEELAAWMRAHRCRWLLLDWLFLWSTRYQAGIPYSEDQMAGDTALALAYQGLPLKGFRSVWRSGGKRDGMRLYVLDR